MTLEKQPSYDEILRDGPSNWGRWGDSDEIGALNLLGRSEVVAAAGLVTQGKVFALGLPVADPNGAPLWPARPPTLRYSVRDKGTYLAGKAQAANGGMEFADDVVFAPLHGTTHVDALAHTWYGGAVYNGYDARTTAGSLERASVEPLARKGIVGRGVLIDIPRARGVAYLDSHDPFTLNDMLEAAQAQAVEIGHADILIIRTGWLNVFYEKGPEVFYSEPFHEPGLLFEEAVPHWFREHDVVAFGTDTAGNEYTVQPESGLDSPLHASLMRNLGVSFIELLWVEDLAADCAKDGCYEFLFVGSPLRIVGGTAGPMNPLAIK